MTVKEKAGERENSRDDEKACRKRNTEFRHVRNKNNIGNYQ